MENSQKYHFNDFTIDNYRRLIKQILNIYSVVPFRTEYKENVKMTIIRHDIDFSPKRCLSLAQVEQEEGISATYFVLLRSEWYNLLSKEYLIPILKIKELGHEIALHFDYSHYNPKNEEELENYLKREREQLENELRSNVRSFSFHNPTSGAMNFRNMLYAGLINVYSDFFRNSFQYVSDSNGIWRHNRLEDVLASGGPEKIQILVHPEHWTEAVTSPHERVQAICKDMGDDLWERYSFLIHQSGRESIDW